MSRVTRFDLSTARLRDDMRTVQGGARIGARLSRIGVQRYTDGNTGKVVREYRSPEAVFDPASLKTFESAAVCIGHPAGVDPSNWKTHAVGQVVAPRVEDNRYVGADIILQDAEALRRANLPASDPDALVECSVGYDCELVMTPGVSPEGEPFDARQTEIRANHLALGPKHWGRAGPEVRLKLDGGVCYAEDFPEAKGADHDDAEAAAHAARELRQRGTHAMCALIDAHGLPFRELADKSDDDLIERWRNAMIDAVARAHHGDRHVLARLADVELEDIFRRSHALTRNRSLSN